MLTIILTLVVIGLILWGLDQIPMDATIKRIIHVVVIILVVLWLLQVLFGFSVGGLNLK